MSKSTEQLFSMSYDLNKIKEQFITSNKVAFKSYRLKLSNKNNIKGLLLLTKNPIVLKETYTFFIINY